MILVRKKGVINQPTTKSEFRLFGNPDEAFRQTKPKRGLLTPVEVRSAALAEMALQKDSIVWDIGAGSGSLSIEAAKIAENGSVYAIEMDVEDHELIKSNAARFNVTNLHAVLGKAPEAWNDLPTPHSIFAGGTGRSLLHLTEPAFDRLAEGGTFVAHVASVENLTGIHEILRRLAGEVQVCMMQFARGNMQLDSLRFEAVNPTFLITATKKTDA